MKYLYILALLFSVNVFSQLNGEKIDRSLPEIVPPSPTVAALMKFEEVPVSNYTGVPNISIPLYSIPTHSKNVVFDLSLSYHPASIAANEIAGFAGLGWNLNAGGTISRTIRGYPDELDQGGSSSERKKGMYHSSNNYYQVVSALGGAGVPQNNEVINEFLWQAQEMGTYDSEHDLYQYNFMGYSGRFYITKQNGVYEVVKLDNDNTMAIEYNAVSNLFTLRNDKGIKFIFDVKEVTAHSTDVSTTYFGDAPLISHAVDYSAVTAYHLSQIYDDNDIKLAELIYNPDSVSYIESRRSVNKQDNGNFSQNPATVVGMVNNQCYGQVGQIVQMSSTTVSTDRIATKKLQRIDITDKAKIEFLLESGRLDSDLNPAATNFRLKEILVKDWNNTVVKQYELVHDYSNITGRRMILKTLKEKAASGTQELAYGFLYKKTPGDVGNGVLGTDYWGYYNFNPTYGRKNGKNTHPRYCTIDVLQKMTLPTGGCRIFDFESNTYSYVGKNPVADYYENFDNWLETNEILNFSSENLDTREKQLQLSLTGENRIATFYPSFTSGGGGTTAGFTLNRYTGANPNGTPVGSLQLGDQHTLYGDSFYRIRYDWLNAGMIGYGSVGIYYYSRKGINDIKQEVQGGGIRIKRIGYFENSQTPQGYYENASNPTLSGPEREKNYNYQFFDQPRKSSGSLVVQKPSFSYNNGKRKHIFCIHFNYVLDLSYVTSTTFNNLSVLKTQGADVGYQNVTVTEKDNGKSQYVYTSPIDFPEPDQAYTLSYPFVPTKNFEYKRGLLQNEKHFRKDGKLLTETISTYSMDESERLTGLRLFTPTNCPFSYRYSMYSEYRYWAELCQSTNQCDYVCGMPISYIGYYFIYEAFGWVKLQTQTTKNYFEAAEPVTTIAEYTYNPFNKKVATHKTITNPSEFKQDAYTYATFPNNKIGELSEIASYDQVGLLSASRLNYSGSYPSNAAYLPASVDVSKGNEVLQPRLNYNGYDEFSNVLEVQLHDGTQTSYIWGYNKTQVIAKIENIGYANINAGLITAAQNASDTAGATGLETALTNLRNSLPNAMVTTYTYKPMVGVSTVTDPKGDKVSYTYDAFGRLTTVRDNNNNILSTNDYHYRTQN